MGEATELALRVLTEKIGLLGYGSQALDSLSRAERVTYCNDHWQNDYRKVCKAVFCSPTVLAEQSQEFAFETTKYLHSADTHNNAAVQRVWSASLMKCRCFCIAVSACVVLLNLAHAPQQKRKVK